MRSSLHDWLHSTRLCAAIIIIACIAIYAQTLTFSFVSLDDAGLIFQNPIISQPFSLHALKQMFSTYDPELYIPLTFFSYQLDYMRAGLNPDAFHLTNLLLHIANALLVFVCIRLLSKHTLVALLCALLFAVHPLNAEAVSWAAARKDLLSGFFFLCAVAAYLHEKRQGNARWYIFSIIFFLLALLSKVSIILLPVVLILIEDYLLIKNDEIEQMKSDALLYPITAGANARSVVTNRIENTKAMKEINIGRFTRLRLLIMSQTSKRLLPFFVLSIIFGIIAILGKTKNIANISPWSYPLLAAKSTAFSLRSIFLPTWFSALHPQVTPITLLRPEFLLPVMLCVGLIVSLPFLRKRQPDIYVGLAFFLLMLIPSFSTFLKNGDLYFTSDRYVYLASIGIFSLIASVAYGLYQSAEQQTIRMIFSGALLILLMALGTKSFVQAQTWKNSLALFTNVLSHYPDSAFAYNNIGSELMNDKNESGALVAFRKAVTIDPHYILPRMNIANIYKNEGKDALADAEYRAAIAAIPTDRPVRADDLTPYYFLSETQDAAGNIAEATRLRKEATVKGPAIAEAWYNYGLILHEYDKSDDAIRAYKKAVLLDSHLIAARYNLAALLAEKGDLPEALRQLEMVSDKDANYEEVQKHIENIRSML